MEATRETSLAETVALLEKENQAMKAKIQEIEAKMALQDEAARVAAVRHAALESVLTKIVGMSNSRSRSARA